MEWISNFLQSIGIDAVWAVFVVAISLAVGISALIWLALYKLQGRLITLPRSDKHKFSSLALSGACRIKPWLVFTCVFFWILSRWDIVDADLGAHTRLAVLALAIIQLGLIIDGVLVPVFATDGKLYRGSSIGAIGLFMARSVLWIVLALITLDNFGVKITALVAGLGVGGIAVALAVKSLLEDILASLTIAIDKPFVHGDSLTIGEYNGTVENIGIKTTHLRSVNGELLVFPNADLLQSRLRNFGRMRERRVTFVIGVTYETSPDKVQKACTIIQDVIRTHEKLRLDRVHFLTFSPSSLDIEVVYWVRSPDFATHANLKQSVNFGILERFNAAGIEFAYPTQRTVGESSPGPTATTKSQGELRDH